MKKYIRHLMQFLLKKPSCEKGVAESIPIPPIHKTFTDTGEFIKAEHFKLIWIDRCVHGKGKHETIDILTDDEYIDYELWVDLNGDALYKEQLPNAKVFSGKNPNIIFHGGCLGCLSQRLHGLERCKGCMYFRSLSRGENLKIEGEEAATMSAAELLKIFKSRR